MRIVALLALLPLSSFAYAGTDCTSVDLNGSTIVYKYHKKTIALVGWTHKIVDDNNELFAGVKSIQTLSVVNKNCDAALEVANKTVNILQNNISNFNLAKMNLDAVVHDYNTRSLGVEATPKDLENAIKNHIAYDKSVVQIEEVCPSIHDQLYKLTQLYKGPAFFLETKKVKIVGVEDEALYAESLAQLDIFNKAVAQNITSKPETNTLVMPLIAADSITTYTDQEIDAMVQKINYIEGRTANTDLIIQAVRAKNRINQLSVERNVVIARNLVGLKGNSALLIGRAHLPGLRDLLDKSCNAQ